MSRQQVQGLPLHTRSLTVYVKPTDSGQWLARGDVIDLRKNGFVPSSYDIQPAGIIHSMNIELDLDPDTLRIGAIRVDQPYVAVEPSAATGGECCRDPAPRLQTLAGECLDEAFAKKLSGVFGGPLGCSHLLTLFQLMASAIPRAAQIERARIEREGTHHDAGDRFFRRSVFVDGLEASETATDVSVQLADSCTRPYDPLLGSIERVELSHEVKLAATIERKRFMIERLALAERQRSSETIPDAEWQDRGDHVASLVGTPLVPGLAKRVFGLTGDDASLDAVRDALLMLAPGFLQVVAAQMEPYIVERAKAAIEGRESSNDSGTLGGQPGACYIWREGGRVSRARFGD